MSYEIFDFIINVWIALMLTVQSLILWKLLPHIVKTSMNSDFFTKTLGGKSGPGNTSAYVPSIESDEVFPNCKEKNNPLHIHNLSCQ